MVDVAVYRSADVLAGSAYSLRFPIDDDLDALFLCLFEFVLPFGRPRPGVVVITAGAAAADA